MRTFLSSLPAFSAGKDGRVTFPQTVSASLSYRMILFVLAVFSSLSGFTRAGSGINHPLFDGPLAGRITTLTPTVNTIRIDSLTDTTALCRGEVTDDLGCVVTARGFV